MAHQDLARSGSTDSRGGRTVSAAMKITTGYKLVALGLSLLGVVATGCGKATSGTGADVTEIGAGITAGSGTSSSQLVSPALSLFSQSMTTNCGRPPEDLCADQLRILTVRAEAVARELRSRSDLVRAAEGVKLGEAVAAMGQQDLRDGSNQSKTMKSAEELDSWLKRNVPGYPSPITPTGR